MYSTRSEYLQVVLTLNYDQVERHKSDIVLGKSIPMIDEDNVTYTFTADYYGDIERKFMAIIRLLADPTLVVKASLDELRGFFAEMILAIERRACTESSVPNPG